MDIRFLKSRIPNKLSTVGPNVTSQSGIVKSTSEDVAVPGRNVRLKSCVWFHNM